MLVFHAKVLVHASIRTTDVIKLLSDVGERHRHAIDGPEQVRSHHEHGHLRE